MISSIFDAQQNQISVISQTDNGVEDDGYAERQAVRFEVLVSTTDMQPSSFVNSIGLSWHRVHAAKGCAA